MGKKIKTKKRRENMENYKMKTSELIKMLQIKIKVHGDAEVRFISEHGDELGNSLPCGGVVTILDKDDKALYNLIGNSTHLNEVFG
jgi:hypothetical protein